MTETKSSPQVFASRLIAVLLALSALMFAACGGSNETPTTANRPANTNTNTPPVDNTPVPPGNIAVLETDAGVIKVELMPAESPRTVDNFKLLAQRGFYNGLIFHRVISGFMIQGGDPNGNGTGGVTATGQPLPNEINRSSPLYQGIYKRGLMAMANRGVPQTATSQFFIMHQDKQLAPAYTIFGKVIEGMEVVDKIASTPTGAQDRPMTPIKMKKVYIQ